MRTFHVQVCTHSTWSLSSFCYFYQVLKCSLQTSSNSSSLASPVATIAACGKAQSSRNTEAAWWFMLLAISHPVTQTFNHGIMSCNKKRANITYYNKISSALRLFFTTDLPWFALCQLTQDSLGSQAVDSGFEVLPDSDSLSVELGSRIPWFGLRTRKPRVRNSRAKFSPDSGIWMTLQGPTLYLRYLYFEKKQQHNRLSVFSQETDMKKLPSYILQRCHS